MSNWKTEARDTVFRAAYSSDPEAVPEYRIPKSRPWWLFWKPREWETVRGVSRAQMQRVQEAMQDDLRRRHARCKELFPNASPYTNLYSPLFDYAPRDSDSGPKGEKPKALSA